MRSSLAVLTGVLLCGCAAGGARLPPEPPPDPVHLSLGVLPIRPDAQLNSEIADGLRMSHLFSSVKAVSSFESPDVDVFISIVHNMRGFKRPSAMWPDVTAFSARSRKRLYTGKSRCGGFDKYCLNTENIAADLARALGPGTEIYASLLAERAERQSGAPSPSPAPSLSSDADRPKIRQAEDPDKFALVIGIGKYQRLPEASFAVRDAQTVREHLLALGYPSRNVILLTGDQATRTGMQKYIEEWLPRNLTKSSKLFVYYSGHGAPDPATGRAYMVPWDGDPQFLQSTAYSLSSLYASLRALKAREVLVALDSCFSGAGGRSVLAEGARPLVTKVDLGDASGGALTLLAAASGDEITTTLPAQDAARRRNREQTPTLQGSGDGVLLGE